MSDNVTTVKRNIDIVFVFDGTGSMGPIIDNVKQEAVRLYEELVDALMDAKTELTGLRIRLITFRDYESDGADAMEQTDFFELPDDYTEFEESLNSIEARGGGDSPENGLEALYYAMRSDFVNGPKDRQIIVLFTDADALKLGERKNCPDYPSDMVDLPGLAKTWMNSNQDPSIKLTEKSRRLILFAPADTMYQSLTDALPGAMFQAVNPSEGMKEINFDSILKVIVASVGK